MPIPKLILFGICFCEFLTGYSQTFKTFDSLRNKAESSSRSKDYSKALSYYQQAIQLPENQKPEISGSLYYDMACLYSLTRDKGNAISCLEKGFVISNSTTHKNPIPAYHITSDTDLDFIRQETDFKNLLKKYYSGMPLEIVYGKEISYQDLLTLIKFYSDEPSIEPIVIKGKLIFYKKVDDTFNFNRYSLQLPNFEGLKVKRLIFEDCSFKLNLIWTTQGQRKENTQHFPFYQFRFVKCLFQGNSFINQIDFIDPPRFIETKFAHDLFVSCNVDQTNMDANFTNDFELDRCSLNWTHIRLNSKTPIGIYINDNMGADSSDFFVYCSSVLDAAFLSNKFAIKNVRLSFGEITGISFLDSKFKNLGISNTNIKSEFIFHRTELSGKLLLERASFTNEPTNDIDWNDLKGSKLAVLKETEVGDFYGTNPDEGYVNAVRNGNFKYYCGDKPENISNDQSFRELLGLYSMFLNLYKNKNDIESFNGCYVEIKELQSKRLGYLYESNKSFKTFFRWKLSQLLKFYVNHGTDPAQAIVISIYIIFWFGVFFFFFPSDWDTTSKKNLIQNFKDFIQKNEKGYLVPFFVLIGGFALSLVNALTLSLNAFITLGFGNIPTHGLARYVCVIEGFMGWFLLSIFTVALINQVL